MQLLRQAKQAMRDGRKNTRHRAGPHFDDVDVSEYEPNIAVAAGELDCRHLLSSVWTADKARC
ncbi:MAG: hypothetical protein ACLUEQ_12150 [Cloacibacillus evryensis]